MYYGFYKGVAGTSNSEIVFLTLVTPLSFANAFVMDDAARIQYVC